MLLYQYIQHMEQKSYMFYDQSMVPMAFGLNNTGSICWMNTLLQALLSHPAVNKTLLGAKRNLEQNVLAMTYCELIEKAMSNDMANLPFMSARILADLNKQLRIKKKKTIGFQQECADEGYTLLLDMLDCPELNNICRNVYEQMIQCPKCMKLTTNRDTSYKIEMFIPADPPMTMGDFCGWIRHHKSLVDVFKCPHCKEESLGVYRVEVLKLLREVVVITFNKFYTKNVAWFPQTMEFPSGPRKLTYSLVGTVCHSGSQYGGHYWANVLRPTNRGDSTNMDVNMSVNTNVSPSMQVYNCNDSHVSAGNMNPSNEVFMLVYAMTSLI